MKQHNESESKYDKWNLLTQTDVNSLWTTKKSIRFVRDWMDWIISDQQTIIDYTVHNTVANEKTVLGDENCYGYDKVLETRLFNYNDNEGKVMVDTDNVNILIMDNNDIGANIKMQQSIVDFEEINHDAVMTQ